MTIQQLIRIARPRFWIYLIGPVLLALAAARQTPTMLSLVIAAYLTLPANLFIYGVNDIYDRDTDRLNAKKDGYEARLPDDKRSVRQLIRAIIKSNLPFLVVLTALLPLGSWWWLLLFVVAGLAYSAPPLRTKARPGLDALTNILYVAPAFAIYTLLTGNQPELAVVAAAWLWCVAMHAFSAVPDIKDDKLAGLQTIATWLGKHGTIIVCAIAYALAAGLSYGYLGWLSLLAGGVYVLLMALSYGADKRQLFKYYTYFPYVNSLLGMALFFYILYT